MKYNPLKITGLLLLAVSGAGQSDARSLLVADTSGFSISRVRLLQARSTDSGGTGMFFVPGINIIDSVEYTLLHEDPIGNNNIASIRNLFHYLRSTRFKKASRDKRLSYRLYFGMAKNFARMKLYPLAMQCYFHTLQLSENDSEQAVPPAGITIDSAFQPFLNIDSSSSSLAVQHEVRDSLPAIAPLLISTAEYLPDAGSVIAMWLQRKKESLTVPDSLIIKAFANGEKGINYAIVLHVKQPKPGSRKAFVPLNNVGHFFITLIKYNEGEATIARSFGFYPGKENFLAATPLHPASEAVFKDDAGHDWDEIIGKFVSRKRFERIIRLLKHYNNRSYHLNNNNCTDFGLSAAAIAGISIQATKGHWPLGKGNNPANAGQSILEGKITNTDTGNTEGLFICTNTIAR